MKLWRNRPLYIALNAFLRVINPAWWVNLFKISHEWDKALNQAMDDGVEVHKMSSSGYTVMLGNQPIWISNFPYAYGYAWGDGQTREEYRVPLHLTRYRLRRYIKSQHKPVKKKEENAAEAKVQESCKRLLDSQTKVH